MLKKRLLALVMAILSFFAFPQSALAAGGFTNGKKVYKTEQEAPKRLKAYMPDKKAEPNGGFTAARIAAPRGAESEAAKLYDGDTAKNVTWDKDLTVTLDMGAMILLSKIRYYAGDISNGGGNCLGTRFYASADNKNFTELAVIEGDTPPAGKWGEIGFSGFGEYRYFRVQLPEASNICEVEWFAADGFSQKKLAGGKYDTELTICAFDAPNDIDATVIAGVFNKNGVMKQASVQKQKFSAGKAEEVTVKFAGTEKEEGDSYRIAVFDSNGAQPMQNPLNYRINGASSDFVVSSVFSSDMILQADKPVTVWGKAPQYSTVEVCLENSAGGSVTRTAEVKKGSGWEVQLGTFSAGGVYTMTVKAGGRKIEYDNITFGDVWLCTGQSNMDYYMAAGEETAKELTAPENVKNDNIRLFNLWNKGTDGAAAPVDNPPIGSGSWQKMDADSAAYCSAVGYYFAKDIQEETDKPVGIINVAVGDTEINRWIPKGEKCGTFTSTDGDLYNNRIKPFEKLAIKGIILYQGEADQYRTHLTAEQYSDAMAGLVDCYRRAWGADLPFYWAQLTRYRVDESIVREGQRQALSKVSEKKNTGMISLIDIVGNYNGGTGSCREDIHPWGKKIAAERFAAMAKRDCYGGTDEVTGPVYKTAEKSGNSLVLTFECVGKLRVMPKERYADKQTDDKIKKENIDVSKPMEFEVAGADGKFAVAEATLDGNKVILTSREVSAPVYARYAWGAYPEMPNLTDDTGLPAAVFTTEKLK